MSQSTDTLEIVSFVSKLYMNALYIKFLLSRGFYAFLFITIFLHGIAYFGLNQNLFFIFYHKYFIERPFDIVLPQSLMCLFNILFNTKFIQLNTGVDVIIYPLSSFGTLYLINQIAPNEPKRSVKIRWSITLLFMFLYFFY